MSRLSASKPASEAGAWRTQTRRRVGRQLLDGPVGQYQLARGAGLDNGNVARLLKDLLQEKAVEVEHEGRPRTWRLATGESERLRQALAAQQQTGEIAAGHRLLWVVASPNQELALARSLRTKTSAAAVAWAARVEGVDAQYLLVVDRRASTTEVAALVQRLTTAGLTVTRMLADEVMGASAFQRHLGVIRDAAKAV